MVVPVRSRHLAVGITVLLVAAPTSAAGELRAGQIAFTTDAAGSDDISIINADGSGRVALTSGPDDDTDPVWAPGGRRLAFVRGGSQPAVYVIRSDGSGLKRVTAGSSPSWSPDGGRLVYARRVGRGSDLYVCRADGSAVNRLTKTVEAESEPEWSPDGRLIAFVRAERGGGSRIYVVRPDGRGARRVATGGFSESSPAWSPDARQLAFVRTNESLGASRVYLTTVAGGRTRPLVGELRLDPAATLDSDPAWAGDGKHIVFVRGARLYSDLYVASVDGKFLRRITDNAIDQVSDRQPSWQRLPSRKRPATTGSAPRGRRASGVR